MATYQHVFMSGLMAVMINSCGKSSGLDEVLGGKVEYLPSGFTASHLLKKGKVQNSILSGNGMYVLFKDLNKDGKLGLEDYCSVNEFKLCDESPSWGVPQLHNTDSCSVNVCATHYPHSFDSMNLTAVTAADSSDTKLQMYTEQELRGMRSIAQMSADQIKNCPKVCAGYFSGSSMLLLDNSVQK